MANHKDILRSDRFLHCFRRFYGLSQHSITFIYKLCYAAPGSLKGRLLSAVRGQGGSNKQRGVYSLSNVHKINYVELS